MEGWKKNNTHVHPTVPVTKLIPFQDALCSLLHKSSLIALAAAGPVWYVHFFYLTDDVFVVAGREQSKNLPGFWPSIFHGVLLSVSLLDGQPRVSMGRPVHRRHHSPSQ